MNIQTGQIEETDEEFAIGLAHLQAFVAREGHADVPLDHVEPTPEPTEPRGTTNMSEASTPAPWHYGRTQGRTGIFHGHSAECACTHNGKPQSAGVRLIFVHDERRPVTGQDVADMKMAKAAPKLAEALDAALWAIENSHSVPSEVPAYVEGRAALAEARGADRQGERR